MLHHAHHDIEVERFQGVPAGWLIKVLAQDGHRFTYRISGDIDAAATDFVRRLIDGGVRSDLVIDRVDSTFRAQEAPDPLPHHG